jgi:hypothetical protein
MFAACFLSATTSPCSLLWICSAERRAASPSLGASTLGSPSTDFNRIAALCTADAVHGLDDGALDPE